LLDSVVKERFDQAFRLNRGRAFYSSLVSRQAVFEEVFLSSQPLMPSINRSLSSAGGAFYSVQTRCQPSLSPPSIEPTEAPTGLNHRPVSPAHSTRIRRPCKPLFKANFLIYKRFRQGPAPEKVRIIGT